MVAYHGLQDPIAMGCIAPGETTLNATVAVVGPTVFGRGHAHDLVAFHFSLERTANAAVSAGRLHDMIGQTVIDDGFLHERRCGTSLHAGSTGNAFGFEKTFADARGNSGAEPATLNGQGERSLDLLAGSHATRADDAFAVVELE